MKLLLIIVPRNHQKELRQSLLDASLPLTQFESEGGFLRKKNFTFLLGVPDGEVEKAIEIVREACASHEEVVAAPVLSSTDVSEAVVASDATRITAGGATVFVLDVAKFEKV
ncbi:MAG: cyclic-di-AMP receptor [Candidatus Doudnabacteria bacterium]|nr:cyclic-di-AMP receptor [Candidatus Doudnabacteria bacterium]